MSTDEDRWHVETESFGHYSETFENYDEAMKEARRLSRWGEVNVYKIVKVAHFAKKESNADAGQRS